MIGQQGGVYSLIMNLFKKKHTHTEKNPKAKPIHAKTI